MSRITLGLVALVALAPAPVLAQSSADAGPSFDCARASTPGERGVCADPTLAARDLALSAAYRRDLAFARDPAELQAQERAALTVRDACTTPACLGAWYSQRRSVLASTAAPAVGSCAETVVKLTGSRLQGAPDSGSAVIYTNGISQVSYRAMPGIAASQPGDRVHLCVVKRPQHCPAGDDRGTVYAAQNLRTGARWRAADSEHMCAGA